MANRNLNQEELTKANELLAEFVHGSHNSAQATLSSCLLTGRKIMKELMHDERGKPGERNKLKAFKRGEQGCLCAICHMPLPEKYCVLDRLDAATGYVPENTRLIHMECDEAEQAAKNYK